MTKDKLYQQLKKVKDDNTSRPLLFDLSKSKDQKRVGSLLSKGKIFRIIDEYKTQSREHFALSNPGLFHARNFEKKFENHLSALGEEGPITWRGRWVYYPWNGTLVHILEEKEYTEVRTARNRYLISDTEQKKFYATCVSIAGLSVGYSILLAIVLEGGCRRIKLADGDNLDLSNMNRIPVGVENIGLHKTHLAARQIYAINPYAKIELFSKGINKNNLNKFVSGADIIIDEIDDFGIKFLLRQEAKRNRIPLLSAIDNEESGLVDIERYDTNPKTAPFNGRLGSIAYDELAKLDKAGVGKMIARLVGIEHSTKKMHLSLREIGKSIISWPQLGGTALLNGAMMAYCVRKIASGDLLVEGRALLSLDEVLTPNYNTKESKKLRGINIKEFAKTLHLDNE